MTISPTVQRGAVRVRRTRPPTPGRSITVALAVVAVLAACSPRRAGLVAAPVPAGSRARNGTLQPATPPGSPPPPRPTAPAPAVVALGRSALGRPITAV